MRFAQSNAAESVSSSSTACRCVRRYDAGHSLLTGFFNASCTACALRVSGEMQTIFRTAQSVGMVSV